MTLRRGAAVELWRFFESRQLVQSPILRHNSWRFQAVLEEETSMTEQDIARNMRAVAHAVAQQELAGLTVPPATANDLRRVARGEIPIAEAIQNVYARFGNVPVFQP
jgi:hypothetical protein